MAAGWQAEIQRFPAGLRALVEAECAAGNAVTEVSHSFPAPPIGACLMLARPVSTRARASYGALCFRARNSSLLSGEWTDAAGIFFVLEPPVPSEEPPSMDEIRAAGNAVIPPVGAAQEPVVDIDCRGEMLTYRDAGRVATVICTFGDPPRLVGRTLTGWWHPAAQRSTPIGAAERETILKRIMDICRQHHGMSRIEREE